MGGQKRDRARPAVSPEQAQQIALSRALSKTLRHAAASQGIAINSNGYCLVSDLLTHSRYKSLQATAEQIKQVVESNDKQRFEFDASGTKIRARQGHSINVDVELTPLTLDSLPDVVVHGTNPTAWESIKTQGLSRQNRLHIHMAAGLPGEVISGMRHSAKVLIYINVPKAMADGIEFFRSANGAILSSGKDGTISPEYFLKVTDRAGNSLN